MNLNVTWSLCCHFGTMWKCHKCVRKGRTKKEKSVYVVFLRWDCKWPLSTERNTFIRTRDPTHCCPLGSVSPHQEAYSKSHYGECSWTGRQTGSSQGSPPGGLGMLYRDPQSFPSSLHASVSVSGLGSSGAAEEAQLRRTANLGWGDGVRAWLVQGAVGWLHVCTIFKGPTRSLHQLITEVQVKNSMRVNSISAKKQNMLSHNL